MEQISSNFTLKVALILKVAHQKLVQNLIKDQKFKEAGFAMFVLAWFVKNMLNGVEHA